MYMGRDAGWINLCSYNPQEAYDLTLMAFKIGEDLNVRLPVMVHQDGFITSHTAQNVKVLQDEEAYNFIGDYQYKNPMLDFKKPVTYGVQTEEDWHFEHKAKQHHDLMTNALPVIEKTFAEFKAKSGREYKLAESYNLDDAEIAIVATGSTVETARIVAQELREGGIKAGVLGIRVLRPIPFKQIQEALSSVKAIACLDRSSPNGAMGTLFNEVSAIMYNSNNRPAILNYIYGLGGRDFTLDTARGVYSELKECADSGEIKFPLQQFIGLRGPKLSFL
jgi:pyruvate ferredoxin oxidoreductase alpha subunit